MTGDPRQPVSRWRLNAAWRAGGPRRGGSAVRMTRPLFAFALLALSACATVDPVTTTTESFFTKVPSDVVALTQSGILSPKHYVPATIPRFSEPALKSGIAFIHKLRDKDGNVIGFGTQMEDVDLDQDGKFAGLHRTAWTVVIPGRGTLFLFETEDSRKLGQALRNAPRPTTEIEWDGPEESLTTGPGPGGAGIIVGGTGEFEGRKGTFVEINRFIGINPNAPSGSPFIFDIEVKVNFTN